MPSENKPTDPRRRPWAGWLLLTAALAVGPGLLLPTAAPAAQHKGVEVSGETGTATPGESGTTSPGESSATPPAETITAPPTETTVAPPREPREPGQRATRNAERRASRRGGCRVKISLAPRRLTAGEPATAAGSVTCPLSTDAAEQTVTIYRHVAGTPGYGVAGTTTTGVDGSYQLTTEPLENNSFFYAVSHGARSGRRAVKVAARVSIAGPAEGAQLLIAGHRSATSARTSRAVTFGGTVSPNDAGARVVLQRESASANEDWRRIGLGVVGADGRYSMTHTFARAGSVSVRVVVRARGMNLAGASEPLSFEIAERQNPLLTLHASANPISYGQSVTIGGIAAGATNEPVTLLAHTRGNSFVEVAKATTDGSGEYTFPAQSPLRSTFYKVTDAHTSSAVLAEGVSSIVTVQAPTSMQAGQPLVVSGTITPSQAGQVFYLQRQNPSGIGFHTVEVGSVGADSSYSIAHTAFSTGTQVFRIKVPADAESQAAASELFKIDVTPAPAATLEEEAPEASSASLRAR